MNTDSPLRPYEQGLLVTAELTGQLVREPNSLMKVKYRGVVWYCATNLEAVTLLKGDFERFRALVRRRLGA